MASDGHFEGPSHSTPVLADPGLGIDLPVICPVPKKECCDCCMIPLTSNNLSTSAHANVGANAFIYASKQYIGQR